MSAHSFRPYAARATDIVTPESKLCPPPPARKLVNPKKGVVANVHAYKL